MFRFCAYSVDSGSIVAMDSSSKVGLTDQTGLKVLRFGSLSLGLSCQSLAQLNGYSLLKYNIYILDYETKLKGIILPLDAMVYSGNSTVLNVFSFILISFMAFIVLMFFIVFVAYFCKHERKVAYSSLSKKPALTSDHT